jgi:uncharacterized protein (TIGR03083 family)
MSLRALSVVDARPYFRPAAARLVDVLRALDEKDWLRPTVAGSWRVRDVVAHLIDTALRRLSLDRDGHALPAPARPVATDRDFVAFINALNRDWVNVTGRLSPRVLTDLYAVSSTELAAFFEATALEAPARFPVSWAGESESQAWFDIGREFTEVWHHQMQIRDAVGAAPPAHPEWLRVVLQVGIRVLPHAYRAIDADAGSAVVVVITGDGGGRWTLRRDDEAWTIWEGETHAPAARISMTDATAWRLLFNALSPSQAGLAVTAEGDGTLVTPLLQARSVIV